MKLATLVALVAVASSSFATVLVDQSAGGSTTNRSDAYSTGGTFDQAITVANRFTLANTPGFEYHVTEVSFWGTPLDISITGQQSIASMNDLTTLEVNFFYADINGNATHNLFSSVSVAPSAGNVVHDGIKTTINLGSSINFGQGGTYWINIGGKSGGIDYSYGWAVATVAPGLASATNGGGGTWTAWNQQAGNAHRFTLSGESIEAVPEPCTMIILAIGAALKARRKKQS
jgi:hypothetical protein